MYAAQKLQCAVTNTPLCVCACMHAGPEDTARSHSTLCMCMHACMQAQKIRRAVTEADKRKLSNRIKHSAPGSIKVKPERKKKIIAQME